MITLANANRVIIAHVWAD